MFNGRIYIYTFVRKCQVFLDSQHPALQVEHITNPNNLQNHINQSYKSKSYIYCVFSRTY